jgi:hypothetical protein
MKHRVVTEMSIRSNLSTLLLQMGAASLKFMCDKRIPAGCADALDITVEWVYPVDTRLGTFKKKANAVKIVVSRVYYSGNRPGKPTVLDAELVKGNFAFSRTTPWMRKPTVENLLEVGGYLMQHLVQRSMSYMNRLMRMEEDVGVIADGLRRGAKLLGLEGS